MAERVPKYVAVPAGRLHGGEILAGVVQVQQTIDSIRTDSPKINEIIHPFAVVLTQDCELAQDFTARSGDGGSKLDNIAFCVAVPTAELKQKLPPGKDIWKRIIQNKDERYQCLEDVPADQDAAAVGVPSLGCDFKRYFTVPADEVYKRIELSQIAHRANLKTPYAEHLLHRFYNFQARVPLPQNHEIAM